MSPSADPWSVVICEAKAGPGGIEQRPAPAHIVGDIGEVELRNHPAARIAVEDDQIELRQPLLEQLTHWKGNQRQFADGRGVMLVGRAQDREVDQVHRRVGFEQIAPDPLARMGLARNQEHFQAVPHAVHGRDSAVVGEAELARPRFHPELEDGGARMIDGKRDALGAAEDDAHGLQGTAVRRDRNQGAAAAGSLRAEVLHEKLDLDLLADDAVGRRRLDRQPPVAVPVRIAGQQHMDRPHLFGSRGRRRRIVDLAVGYQYGPGPPAPGDRRPGLA